jgi:hypothetical protein
MTVSVPMSVAMTVPMSVAVPGQSAGERGFAGRRQGRAQQHHADHRDQQAADQPEPAQHLFTGDGNGKIYKFDLDGKLLGWAQTSQNHGQNGCLVHELHCDSDTVLYKGDCSTWQVEKITISQ